MNIAVWIINSTVTPKDNSFVKEKRKEVLIKELTQQCPDLTTATESTVLQTT